MAFRVGQEVTLKEESGKPWDEIFGRAPASQWMPRFKAVYVITHIDVWVGHQFLNFAEDSSGSAWDAREFAPVVKTTTDISIFTRMLDEVRPPERVSP